MFGERGKNCERGYESAEMIAKLKRSLQILITAGPTREPIDKVRFITNASTGKMGYELARAAVRRGHHVILVSGPTNILPPEGVEFISTTTALQMRDKVKKYFKHCNCLIMAAAVSDFRPERAVNKKIKKKYSRESINLELVKNPDILYEIGKEKNGKTLVGFALETENLVKNAQAKLKEKNLDFIIATQLTPRNSLYPQGTPFGDRRVRAVIISREGKIEDAAFYTKKQLAGVVLRRVEEKPLKPVK